MNKLNIKEANEHLKQLHRKVFELENQVHMHTLHTQELERTNAQLRERLKATEESRESELAEKEAREADLLKRLSECENRVDVLLAAAEERDRLVERLETKAQLFYEVVEHRATLSRMVEVLDEIHRQEKGNSAALHGASSGKLNGHGQGENSRRTDNYGHSTSSEEDRQSLT